MGLNVKLSVQRCPYRIPPAIEVQSEGEWTINGIPRLKADAGLCQAIMAAADACVGCPLNIPPKEPSEFLSRIVELAELIETGARLRLPLADWKALALLRRKRNERANVIALTEAANREVKAMKERSK